MPLSTRMPLVRRLSLEEPTKLMARIKVDYLWSGLTALFAEFDLAAAQGTSGGTITHCSQELPKGY